MYIQSTAKWNNTPRQNSGINDRCINDANWHHFTDMMPIGIIFFHWPLSSTFGLSKCL